MRSKQQILVSLFVIFLCGMAVGIGYATQRQKQENLKQTENQLAVFANVLSKTRIFDFPNSLHPTTRLGKAYQQNVVVDIGELYVLWNALTPELIQQGFSGKAVGQIGEGLQIVDENILPPYGTTSNPKSVQEARNWIVYMYNALYPNKKIVSSNAVYFQRLKRNVNLISNKYRSYHSNPNFQVFIQP